MSITQKVYHEDCVKLFLFKICDNIMYMFFDHWNSEYKFTGAVMMLTLLLLVLNFNRIFIQNKFDVYVLTECSSENCFVYNEEKYAFLQKSAESVSACQDEECITDQACLENGSCEYVDCEDRELTQYFSAYSC